jgi:hypothetical protein
MPIASCLSRAKNAPRARLLHQGIAGLAAVIMLLAGTPGSALELGRHASDGPTLNAIEAKGRIEVGDAVALQAYIAKLPPKKTIAIYLNSPGGSYEEGIALGRFFHRAKIRTVVPANALCSSACTTAFLGGRDAETDKPWRAKSSTARLGFHSFKINWPDKDYTPQDMSTAIARTQRMTLEMADYMTEVGASLQFLRARLKAPAAEMHFMSNEEALALGVIIINDRTGELITSDFLKTRAGR